MQPKNITRLAAAAPAVLSGAVALAADRPQVDPAKVDAAFETLKTYDWGDDRNKLNPIDEAVVASQGDAGARDQLEQRLLDLFAAGVSRSAEDFILRTLKTIGTAKSVPPLASLLPNDDLSHMSRYALERIPADEAAAALRDALPKVQGELKVGVIGSLGVRRDTVSAKALAGLLSDADRTIAKTAAHALGLIGSLEAGKALAAAAPKASAEMKQAITDACFTAAEQLLADGNKAEAVLLYKLFTGQDQPKHVRLAATKGMLAAAGQ